MGKLLQLTTIFNANAVTTYIIGGAIAFFFLNILSPLAIRIKLVDTPGGRKHHQGQIPLIGGIGMFLGFVFAVLTMPMSLEQYRAFLAGAGLLVVIGVLDDFHELSHRARLIAQVFAAAIMAIVGANYIKDLGNLFFTGDIYLGWLGIPFTIFATVGVINAVNMIDGVDGLAASLTLVELILLTILAWISGHAGDVNMLLLLSIVVFAYLILNFPLPGIRARAKIFMGDAGSMFLGFCLAWFLVSLSQGAHPAARPVTMLWILAIPLLDTTRLIVHRLLKRQSPFAPDSRHLHHLLMTFGLKSWQITLVISLLALILGLIGIAGGHFGISAGIMFTSFLCVFIIFYIIVGAAWRKIDKNK